jgi:hypothetical protein
MTSIAVLKFQAQSIGREFIEDAHAYYAALAAPDRLTREISGRSKIESMLPFSEPICR